MEGSGVFCSAIAVISLAGFLVFSLFLEINCYHVNKQFWDCSKYKIVNEGKPNREQCIQYTMKETKP